MRVRAPHRLADDCSWEGKTLPQNVADICNWTHMCEAEPNIHATDHGHELIAGRYEPVLRKAVK